MERDILPNSSTTHENKPPRDYPRRCTFPFGGSHWCSPRRLSLEQCLTVIRVMTGPSIGSSYWLCGEICTSDMISNISLVKRTVLSVHSDLTTAMLPRYRSETENIREVFTESSQAPSYCWVMWGSVPARRTSSPLFVYPAMDVFPLKTTEVQGCSHCKLRACIE